MCTCCSATVIRRNREECYAVIAAADVHPAATALCQGGCRQGYCRLCQLFCGLTNAFETPGDATKQVTSAESGACTNDTTACRCHSSSLVAAKFPDNLQPDRPASRCRLLVL